MNVITRPGISRQNNTSQQLAGLFPSPHEIPREFRLDAERYVPCCLLDGEVRPWNGPLDPVSSPICLRQDGMIERPVPAHVPATDESTALAALDAATRAWGSGRGRWPLALPEARIEAVEAFLSSMSGEREEIVRLLMWEVGKSLEESRAEVDRTVDYIRMTIEALREASTAEARPRGTGGGIVASVKASPLGVCLLMGGGPASVYGPRAWAAYQEFVALDTNERKEIAS